MSLTAILVAVAVELRVESNDEVKLVYCLPEPASYFIDLDDYEQIHAQI